MTSLLSRRWIPAVLVCFVVCLAHLQAPGAEEFHYDDGHSLVRNPHLRDLGNLPLFFTDASLFGENPDDRMYRPLVLVTHSLNLALTGPEPGGFATVNLLIHALSAGLATWLLCLVLPSWPALVGGLLFGLHPPQTEVVHYASARSESLAGLFVLLALAAFISSQRTGSRWWSTLSLVGAGIGLLCKATAVTTPALIFLIHTRLHPSRPVAASLRASATSSASIPRGRTATPTRPLLVDPRAQITQAAVAQKGDYALLW